MSPSPPDLDHLELRDCELWRRFIDHRRQYCTDGVAVDNSPSAPVLVDLQHPLTWVASTPIHQQRNVTACAPEKEAIGSDALGGVMLLPDSILHFSQFLNQCILGSCFAM